MSMPFLNNLDLNNNQLLNVKLQVLASDPTALEAKIYYNSASHTVRVHNGTSWQDLAMGTITIDHHQLTNLTTYDDHTQYVHISNARTITAVHSFNPASAGAPFALGANANNQLVTGLNADKLDGYDASAFAPLVHVHTHGDITDWNTAVLSFRLDQFAAPTTSVSMNSQRIINLADPTGAQDAATKAYVDAARAGLDAKDSARVLYNLGGAAFNPSATPNTVDGLSLAVNDRVLVLNAASSAANGLYVVGTVGTGANGVWTRATDADSNAEVTSGMYVLIDQGATYKGSGWVLTTPDPITVGTTGLVFVQFSGPGSTQGQNLGGQTYTVYAGLSGNTLQFNSFAVGSNKLSGLQAANTITFDVVESNLNVGNMGGTLPLNHGGTGATSAAAARANLGATTKYVTTLGDGTATSYVITHNLNTQDVTVAVRETSAPYRLVYCDVEFTSVNTLTLKFGSTAPTSGQYSVAVVG